MKINSFLLAIMIVFNCKGQNLVFVGDKSYQATQKWYFDGNGDKLKNYVNSATIQIGKKGQSGIFSISLEAFNSSSGIKGAIRIYLDNSTTIVLEKVLAKDYSDGLSTVIYEISAINLLKLKQSNINTIRLNSGITGFIEGTTVSNKWDSDPNPIIYDEFHWNTASEISILFSE
jgi:hypothetical protein